MFAFFSLEKPVLFHLFMADQGNSEKISIKTDFFQCEAIHLFLQYKGVTIDMNKICFSSHRVIFPRDKQCSTS